MDLKTFINTKLSAQMSNDWLKIVKDEIAINDQITALEAKKPTLAAAKSAYIAANMPDEGKLPCSENDYGYICFAFLKGGQ